MGGWVEEAERKVKKRQTWGWVKRRRRWRGSKRRRNVRKVGKEEERRGKGTKERMKERYVKEDEEEWKDEDGRTCEGYADCSSISSQMESFNSIIKLMSLTQGFVPAEPPYLLQTVLLWMLSAVDMVFFFYTMAAYLWKHLSSSHRETSWMAPYQGPHPSEAASSSSDISHPEPLSRWKSVSGAGNYYNLLQYPSLGSGRQLLSKQNTFPMMNFTFLTQISVNHKAFHWSRLKNNVMIYYTSHPASLVCLFWGSRFISADAELKLVGCEQLWLVQHKQ